MALILSSPHPAWIEIQLEQFRNNLHILKNHIGNAKLCLPVKGNAYGHGLAAIGKIAETAGVDYLGVSCLQEGITLREAGIQTPILVFGAIHEDQIPALLTYQFEVSLSSEFKAKLLAEHCETAKKSCRVHLEIDTGMQRTGVRLKTAISLLEYIESIPQFELAGVYSHLATADKPNDPFAQHQIQIFRAFIAEHVKPKHPQALCHIANSGGTCYYPESHLDMVRPGLIAYGYFPGPTAPTLHGIAPLISIHAKIAYSKIVDKNQGISYGHTYKTPEKSRIITIPVGYGDGYRRCLSNRAKILLQGKRFPIVGTICMDQFMVNIGDDSAHVGEKVTLIGKTGNSEITLEEIAQLCDTIPYEILCGFNDRLPRFYV